jgi:hypothetical protein
MHIQACRTHAASDPWKTAELEVDCKTKLSPLQLARKGSYCSGRTDFEQEAGETGKNASYQKG